MMEEKWRDGDGLDGRMWSCWGGKNKISGEVIVRGSWVFSGDFCVCLVYLILYGIFIDVMRGFWREKRERDVKTEGKRT